MSSKKAEDLHMAARNGDLNAVISILSSNPLAVNSRDKHSRTPLHLAAWAGQTQIVSYLCTHKADVGAAAMDDMAAIHFAAQKGHLEIIKTLHSSGVSLKSINRKGMTALHYAAQGSHLDLARYLVRKGVNLGAKTKSGKTPLDLASNEEMKTFLMEAEKTPPRKEEKTSKEDMDDKEGAKEHGTIETEAKEEIKEECGEGGVKRKEGEELEDGEVESSPKAKKAKVALKHLLASDDTQEGEEED